MTNEQILKKAIEKAKKNGWKDWTMFSFEDYVKEYGLPFMIPKIIFSHSFAKAFWGEEMKYRYRLADSIVYLSLPEWQYHLQQTVLEKEPLKYLEKFL